MSTTLAKPGQIERKWYVLDAAGKPLGRVAAKAAALLRGKGKVIFTPNVDCGDHVIIINSDKAVLTGSKLDKKYYYHHSGWIGGMKAVQYRTLMAEKSDKAMTVAAVDRLVHHATILEMNVESYRRRAALPARRQRSATPTQ